MIPVVVGSNPIIHPSFKPGSGLKSVHGPLAQLVEQLTLNQLVEGSNPSRPTNKAKTPIACDRRLALCVQRRMLRAARLRLTEAIDGFADATVSVLVLYGRATVK